MISTRTQALIHQAQLAKLGLKVLGIRSSLEWLLPQRAPEARSSQIRRALDEVVAEIERMAKEAYRHD